MPWLKLFPLLLTLLSFLQPLAANASTLLLPLAAVESADVSAAHRDAVSFCRSTAKDSSAHRDALGASLVAVIDGTATAADYENIGGGIADFGMVAVIGGVKGAGEGAKRPSGFRKQTVQDAWEDASTGSRPGARACPTCGKDVEVAPGQGRRDWDVDHQPPWSMRDLSGKTRKEVLDDYSAGTRLECPGCNRSRGARPAE